MICRPKIIYSVRNSVFFVLILLLLISTSVKNVSGFLSFSGKELKRESVSKIIHNTTIARTQELEKEFVLRSEAVKFEERSFQIDPESNRYKVKFSFTKKLLLVPDNVPFSGFFRKDVHTENIEYCDKAHGLFSNTIMTLLEDADGYFWLGSEGQGLCKTNGARSWIYTTEHGLKSDYIKYIFQDSRKRIWLAWDRGLSFLSGDTLYHLNNPMVNTAEVQRIREDKDGSLWFCASRNGLFHLNSQNEMEVFNKQRGFPAKNIKDISFGPNGEKYIAAMDHGLLILKGNRGTVYSDPDPVGIRFAPTSVLYDKGRIWMGSYFGSNYFFEKGTLQRFDLRTGYQRCYSILKNDLGIWYADYGYGVFLIRKDGKIKRYSSKSGLADRNALDISFDHNNNVWVADPFSGLSVIKPSPFSLKSWPIIYPLKIAEIDDDHLWFSTNGNGLVEIDKGIVKWHNIVPDKQNLTLDHSWDFVIENNGDIWSTSHGLGLALMKKDKTVYFQFDEGNVISDLTQIPNGDIWFSGEFKGLRKWDKTTGEFYSVTESHGLVSNNVRSSVLDPTGALWVATDKGVDIIQEGKVRRLNKKNGLCSDNISVIYHSKNGMTWLGSKDGGISVLQKGKIKIFNVSSGLISNNVIGIQEAKDGSIWVSTLDGLSQLSQKGDGDFSIQNYDKNAGAFMLDFTTAIESLNDGRTLFGTVKGVVEYDPYMAKEIEGQPKLKIEGFVFNGAPVLSGKISSITVHRNDDLFCDAALMHWGRLEQVSVFYGLIEMGAKQKVDPRWTKINLNAVFPIDLRVKDAQYQLVFRVENGDKVHFFDGPQLKIDAPWFESWWFYGLIVSFAVALLILLFRYRLNYLNKRREYLEREVKQRTEELNREKEELAKANTDIEQKVKEKDVLIYEMHHRVKNNLQTISTLLDMQLRTVRDERGAAVLRDSVRRISAMSASHELLYSGQDNLSKVDLNGYIQDLVYSQQLMLMEEGKYPKIHYELSSILVGVSDAISVGMILSEVISNSVKHAFKGVDNPEIKIILRKGEEKYELIVSDNGTGNIYLNNEGLRKGLGYRLIRIFVQKINGSVKVDSSEFGTSIKIWF